jgi:hypothetical protein
VAKVAFTGSTATGKKVMANAAGTLKRLTLELAGNDAAIVLEDADPKEAAGRSVPAAGPEHGRERRALSGRSRSPMSSVPPSRHRTGERAGATTDGT